MERLRKRTKPNEPQQLEKDNDDLDDLDCRICHKKGIQIRFSREDTLLAHIRSVHCGETTCNICSKVMSSEQALQRHQLTHTDDRPFFCALCSKSFKREDTLHHHERTVHRDERGIPVEYLSQEGNDIFIAYQCRRCLDERINHHHLVWCMRYGKPYREHQCLICFKTTHYCRFCQRHHSEHSLEEIPKSKGFQCDRCFKLVSSQKALNKHNSTCEKIPEKLQYKITSSYDGHLTVSYL